MCASWRFSFNFNSHLTQTNTSELLTRCSVKSEQQQTFFWCFKGKQSYTKSTKLGDTIVLARIDEGSEENERKRIEKKKTNGFCMHKSEKRSSSSHSCLISSFLTFYFSLNRHFWRFTCNFPIIDIGKPWKYISWTSIFFDYFVVLISLESLVLNAFSVSVFHSTSSARTHIFPIDMRSFQCVLC